MTEAKQPRYQSSKTPLGVGIRCYKANKVRITSKAATKQHNEHEVRKTREKCGNILVTKQK